MLALKQIRKMFKSHIFEQWRGILSTETCTYQDSRCVYPETFLNFWAQVNGIGRIQLLQRGKTALKRKTTAKKRGERTTNTHFVIGDYLK